MLQNLFWQSFSGAGNWASSAKQEDGAGAALFRASIGIVMHLNCSFDRCPQAHMKTKKEKKEHSLHQKLFIWQSLASRTGNLGQGFPALVRMGSWEERECSNFKGRIKTQLFESDAREMAKGNALLSLNLWWCIRLNLWCQLIGPLVRSWPETKTHQVYCHVKSYIWL